MAEEEKKKALKPAQIAASAMAAVAAAFLGSTLGVEGTIAGAGIASVVSTVGGEVFLRSLRKGGQTAKKTLVARPVMDTRLRQETAGVEPAGLRPLNPLVQQPGPYGQPQRPGQPPTQRAPMPGRSPGQQAPVLGQRAATPPAGPGDQRVRHLPALNGKTGIGQTGAGQPANGTSAGNGPTSPEGRTVFIPRPGAPTQSLGTGPGSPTQVLGMGAPGGPGAPTQLVGPPGTGDDGPGAGEQGKRGWWKNRWVLAAGTSVVAFVIGMLVLTGFEGITGTAVSGGSGTTFSQVVGKSNNTDTTTKEPAETGTETRAPGSPTTKPSSTQENRTNSSPTPTQSSQSQPTGGPSTTESPQPTESAAPTSN